MTPRSPDPAERVGSGRERLVSGAVTVAALTLLGVARWLEPSTSGHSTHMQLGLSPCSFLATTGWPCPMCGATTTFALLADGRPVEALLNQPFAALLFCLTCIVAAIGAAEALAPRSRWRRLSRSFEPYEGRLGLLLLMVMGLAWAWKLALFAQA